MNMIKVIPKIWNAEGFFLAWFAPLNWVISDVEIFAKPYYVQNNWCLEIDSINIYSSLWNILMLEARSACTLLAFQKELKNPGFASWLGAPMEILECFTLPFIFFFYRQSEISLWNFGLSLSHCSDSFFILHVLFNNFLAILFSFCFLLPITFIYKICCWFPETGVLTLPLSWVSWLYQAWERILC